MSVTSASQIPDQKPCTRRSRLNEWLCAAPLLVVLGLYLYVSGHTAGVRLMRPWSMSPWESEIVVDAWRAVNHQRVYTDPATGHATHMYGPLATYAVAPFVKLIGPDPRIPRLISLVAALTACLLAASVFGRAQRGASRLLSGLLIFPLCYLQFYRIREWATEARPDATSLLFALVSLLLLYRACTALTLRRAIGWTIGGTVAIVIGFLFKQTAASVILIPPLVLLLIRPADLPRRLALVAVPFIAIGATLLLLRVGWPQVYFYVVTVPRKYPVAPAQWLLAIFELLHLNVLFIACLFIWIMRRLAQQERIAEIDVWLLVTIGVTGVIGAAARAKFGGYYNSLLPATVAMAIFSGRELATLFRILGTTRWPRPATLVVIAGIVIPAMLPVADIAAVARTLDPGRLALQQGDRYVKHVIATAKKLPGKFVSPDDPIIALRAKGYAGRCGDCELDAAGRNLLSGFPVPAYMIDELRDADWVLQINAARPPSIPDDVLKGLGFHKTTGILPPSSVYILWSRTDPTTRRTDIGS